MSDISVIDRRRLRDVQSRGLRLIKNAIDLSGHIEFYRRLASRVGENFTLAARRFIPTAVAGRLGGKVAEVDAFDPVYPNPFNNAVVLPFRLSRDSRVELAIYNALGQREALLVQGRLEAGEHRVGWEGASAASGNYLAVLNVDGKMRMRQLALIK